MKNCLWSHLYLQLKNRFTLKKSSTYANLTMGKPGNRFTMINTEKKNNLRNGSASLLKNSLWDSFQFLLVQINLLVFP